jgi:hypothetical protein
MDESVDFIGGGIVHFFRLFVSSGIERVHRGHMDVNGFFDFESMLDLY